MTSVSLMQARRNPHESTLWCLQQPLTRWVYIQSTEGYCPCSNIHYPSSASQPPSYVGNDYFCDTVVKTAGVTYSTPKIHYAWDEAQPTPACYTQPSMDPEAAAIRYNRWYYWAENVSWPDHDFSTIVFMKTLSSKSLKSMFIKLYIYRVVRKPADCISF